MVKKAKKKKRGQPTKYNPKYVQVAGELCREKGYTDKNLAVHFKVSEATINNWKKEYLDFLESIKKGKDDFDTRVVEQSLLKRAIGYSYVETTRELQADNGVVLDDDEESESSIQTLVVTKKVTKQISPDVTAQIFWLKNRDPQRWSDMKEIEHKIKTGEPLTVEEMKQKLKDLDNAGNGLATN